MTTSCVSDDASASMTGPLLVVDLDVVRDNYAKFARALPDTRVFYAVKANPGAEAAGAAWLSSARAFDTASVVEIGMALARPASRPTASPIGNTIKKERDIVRALELGVRLFAVDCEAEVEKIARAKAWRPGAEDVRVFCPHPVRRRGRRMAAVAQVRLRARPRGGRARARASCRASDAYGVSFHVGSQQPEHGARGTARSRLGFRASSGRSPSAASSCAMVNLGGGFPTRYLKDVPGRGSLRRLDLPARCRSILATGCPRRSSSPAAAWWGTPACHRV